MSWLDIHKRKVANEGKNIRQAYVNQSANFININFEDSPTFLTEKVLIGEDEYDARFIIEKKFTGSSMKELRKLLLRPFMKVTRGQYAYFNNKNWLIMFFEDDDLYPKAHIEFCNNILKFKNGNEYPCVCDNKSQPNNVNEENPINLPENTMKITVSYNDDTKEIVELDRFVINGMAWEVRGFDRVAYVYDEQGLIEINVKKVPLKEDEKPVEEIPEIPIYDYHVEIVGSNQVEINKTTTFTANVYLDGLLTTEMVEWFADRGTILDGQYTAPTTKGEDKVTVRFEYTDGNGVLQSITIDKTLNIFSNNDWSW